MAITTVLGFVPIWNSFDLVGRPAGGASLVSLDSKDPSNIKRIFSDAAGTIPYPVNAQGGILFNNNGEAPGPFYFSFDSNDPTSLYDLFLFDTQGNKIWETLGYFPGGGGGGGGGSTTVRTLKNYITNSSFWRNVGSPNTAFSTSVYMVLAPSNHENFVNNIDNIATIASPGPDILFMKSDSSAADTLSFNQFQPLGLNPLTGDIPQEFYLNYTCTVGGTETYKVVQFPIMSHVRNLANQIVTVDLWAMWFSGLNTLQFRFRQFFGSGAGASPDAFTVPQTLSIGPSGTWVESNLTETIPTITGKTLGPSGDDALFLQILLPRGAATNINFAKPAIFLGTVPDPRPFETYDDVNAVISSPRTGDLRLSINNFAPFGWLPMNDGTIGNESSVATTRKNIDTFALFSTLYLNVSNANAPVSGGRTAPGNNMTSAIIDFNLNKTIALTKAVGLALVGTNPGLNIGLAFGSATHTLVPDNLPPHTHLASPPGANFVVNGPANNVFQTTGTNVQGQIVPTTGNNITANTAIPLSQPSVLYNVFIKL